MSIGSLLFRGAILAGLCWSSLVPACAQAGAARPGEKNAIKTKQNEDKHKKTVRGTDQRGVTPTDSTPAPVATPGPYYALVIGINDYRSPLPKLNTAVPDAKEVAKLLQEGYQFKEPKLLLNPTRAEILVALQQYRNTLPPQSNLLIYYAGHGQKDPKTDTAYWLPADATRDSDVNWISAGTITEEISAMPSQHVLIISDSCYSGGLTRSGDVRGLPPPVDNDQRNAYFRRMLESRSRNVMASGRNEPVADDGTAGHSRFAYALLQSLQLIDEDRFTAGYLFEIYVQPAVGGGLGSEQVPQYAPILRSGHEWGDFVFSRKSGFKPSSPLSPISPRPARTETASTPANPPGGSLEAERAAINAVVNRYVDAYNQRDPNALWSIWPDSSAATKQAIQRSFSVARAITMKVTDRQIDSSGTSATVTAQFSQQFIPKAGGQQQSSGLITFNLERRPDAWVIVSVK